jgi:hypothetical protein
MVLAYMAGLHYWWPKITGRMYSDWWSKFAAIVSWSAVLTNTTWRRRRMNPDNSILTAPERDELELTVLVRHRLEEQYPDLDHQHETAALGMWVFLATEVMFFGTLFLGVAV